jgi:hypothetical protein
MGWILPTLDQGFVTRRMFNAIMAEEKEVFIQSIIWYLKNIMAWFPLSVRNKLSGILVGEGMEYFVGRVQEMHTSRSKKD